MELPRRRRQWGLRRSYPCRRSRPRDMPKWDWVTHAGWSTEAFRWSHEAREGCAENRCSRWGHEE
eukprot:9500689-Pyramimonas_sp.AAC.1